MVRRRRSRRKREQEEGTSEPEIGLSRKFIDIVAGRPYELRGSMFLHASPQQTSEFLETEAEAQPPSKHC